MTGRQCVSCGLPEDRKTDDKGRETTNLEPITQQCLRCLVESSGAKPKPMPAEPFDAKLAASGDRE